MNSSASFDIKTAKDFFDKMLMPEYEEFCKKNSSSRHALLTTILAYHMYEWVNNHKFSEDNFKTDYPSELDMIRIFELARNITNSTKHFISTAITSTQKGFSTAFSYSYARPLNVELPDGSEMSADKFLKKIIEFWKNQRSQGAF